MNNTVQRKRRTESRKEQLLLLHAALTIEYRLFMEVWSSSLTAAEVIFHKRKVNNLEQREHAAWHGNVILNCQERRSFHKMNNLKHISHYAVCVRSGLLVLQQQTEQERKNEERRLGVLQQEEEEHLCALMLMTSERMEKRKKPVRGWSCWQALNVQLPHITLHHTLCILAYSLLTGCEASFLSALEMKWPPCGHPTISSGN